jgi:chaperone BCS1
MLTNLCRDHGTSTVQIDDSDDLYGHFISWISAQRMTELSRALKATTKPVRSFDDDYDPDEDLSDVLDDSGLFSYDKWAGNAPVSYEPNSGDDNFTHNGNHFHFTKEERDNKYMQRSEQSIVIRCTGRSTQPIKDLLSHVKDWSSKKLNNETCIYRSTSGRWAGTRWENQAVRPARPISTVSLDETQKARVVADINEYLHPATAQWYAARGIPHRRGYLFHGPPGTGKTSLSFALAGMFGLSIYCASLSESELSESVLATLFSMLPHRCIVLLEDIDSAGIRRDDSSGDSDLANGADSDLDGTVEQKEKQKSLRGRLAQTVAKRIEHTIAGTTDSVIETLTGITPRSGDKGGKSNISLAGLLNIIDGAASHEVSYPTYIECDKALTATQGRVLIMTTNYPEKLDSALIRPGRVDLQIKFTLATREQIREIFRRMYSTEHDVKINMKPQTPDSNTPTLAQDGINNICTACTHNHAAQGASMNIAVNLPPEKLAEMADQFAAQVPDMTFSPAEIQGYLLMKKKDPVGAVKGVKEWGEKILEAKKKGKKVVDVK